MENKIGKYVKDVTVNFNKVLGKIKVMHAVNNGPSVSGIDQTREKQDAYRACCIPYVRTHDASFYIFARNSIMYIEATDKNS